MTNNLTVKAEARTESGKGAARALRRQGYVPAVIYGHGEETQIVCQSTARQFPDAIDNGKEMIERGHKTHHRR